MTLEETGQQKTNCRYRIMMIVVQKNPAVFYNGHCHQLILCLLRRYQPKGIKCRSSWKTRQSIAFIAEKNNQEFEVGCQGKNEILFHCGDLKGLSELSDRSIGRVQRLRCWTFRV